MASTERRYRIICSCFEDGVLYEDADLAKVEKRLATYHSADANHDLHIEYADFIKVQWKRLPDAYGSEGEYL